MENVWIMKVSMPFRYFQYFIEDAKVNYRNNYWFKIAFEELMYANLISKEDKDIVARIEAVKMQLLDFIDEKYSSQKNMENEEK